MTPSILIAPSQSSSTPESFTEMSNGDVEAIGAHCQMAYCHVLDFLPFRCESCRGTYCLDHRSETSHKCPKEGEWARKRNALNASTNASLPKPSLLNHDHQCSDTSCKMLIYTNRMPGNHCTTCNRHYCLKHRMQEDHDCKNLKLIGARPTTISEGQKAVKSALSSFRKAWGARARAFENTRETKVAAFAEKFKTKEEKTAAQRLKEINELKKTARGESSIPQDKRIYLHVKASADTTKSKYPSGKFFYNKDWTVGRVLDLAAKALQVENVNNRGGGEEDKLRVFHVEGGRPLRFSDKIGAPCQTGNTIVLLRGVGDPDLIEL
ncbi:AN1 zinc finger protein [Lindgomyces ingoldianus]|uniref:AN1 zinc finger protein n=1 Tax=Lindgomyces ingoldianus TaxID=673940 RepID=A0ACB6QCZ5_9PLEO|nr:AN1 zinc finger protein [Lindgomyces ingoldianus]KAF2464483.1 AN1 zinc finger protein [Lindgomyces ingoldianus]